MEIVEAIVTGATPTIDTVNFATVAFIAEIDEADMEARSAVLTSANDAADLFPASYHPVRLAANAAFSDPDHKPSRFIIVRRAPGTSEAHSFEIERGGAPADGEIRFVVDKVRIVSVSYTETDTAEDVADKLANAVNEIVDQPFRAEVVEDTGDFFVVFTSQFGSNEYIVELDVKGDVVVTADVSRSVEAVASSESIVDVLSALEDLGVAFFGVTMLSTRPADLAALSAAVEGSPRLAAIRKNDPQGEEETDPEATGHPYAALKDNGYSDVLAYSHPEVWKFPELRNFVPTISINPDERSSTFALRSPSGIGTPIYAQPRSVAETALRDYNVNFFRREHGVLICWEGTVPSGEYGDIRFSTKWLVARIKERVFSMIQGAVQGGGKVKYDDDGAAELESELRGLIADAIGADHVTASIDPEYQVPKRVDIPSAQVQSRQFPPIVVTAFWAGAVHRAQFRFVLLF